MTKLSCHHFRANEVRLRLLPLRVGNWSLTGLQQRFVKTGGRLIKHACYYWLLRAEGHLTRRLFGAVLRRLGALPRQRDSRGQAEPRRFNGAPGRGGVSTSSIRTTTFGA
jgi:hypothetical protein